MRYLAHTYPDSSLTFPATPLNPIRRAPSRRNDDEPEEEEEEAGVENSNDNGGSASADASASLLQEDDPDDPRVRAKKAKMDIMWQRLNGGASKAAAAGASASGATNSGGIAASPRGSAAAASINLAELCRAPAPKRSSNASSDQVCDMAPASL